MDVTPVIEFSESRAAISKALFVMQQNLGDVKKNATNPAFRSKYADLSSVVDAVSPALEKAKLTLLQGAAGEFHDGDYCTIVETMLLHESGEYVRARLMLKPSKQDPQGAGSAVTYGRRYGLQALTGVCPDDDDGNAASTPRTANFPSPKAVTAPPPPPSDGPAKKIDIDVRAKLNAVAGKLPPPEIEATIKDVQKHYKNPETGLIEDLHEGDEARDAYKFLKRKADSFAA